MTPLCQNCSTPYEQKAPHQLYCSVKCRRAWSNRRFLEKYHYEANSKSNKHPLLDPWLQAPWSTHSQKSKPVLY